MRSLERTNVVNKWIDYLLLDSKHKKYLEENIIEISLSTGEALNQFKQKVPGIFFISSGLMRVVFQNENEELITVSKAKKSEFIGCFQLFNELDCFSLTASTNVKGYLLPTETLFNLIRENRKILEIFSKVSSEELYYLSQITKGSVCIDSYELKEIVNYNIKNFNKINLIEKGKHLIKGNNRWLICSSGIKELPIGSVITAPINIENQRELPVKICKLEIDWPFVKAKTEQKQTYNEKTKEKIESFEEWYGNSSSEKIPFNSGDGGSEEIYACLRMISIFFEIPFRKDLIKKIIDDQLKRIKKDYLELEQIAAILDFLGLKSSRIDIDSFDSFKNIPLPAILLINSNPKIIWKKFNDKYLISDPLENLSWQDEHSLFYQKNNNQKKLVSLFVQKTNFTPKSKFGFKWFIPSIIKHRNKLLLVVIASFFIQLMALFNPLLIQQIIDAVISQGNLSSLNILGGLLILLSFSQAVLSTLRTYLFADTTNRIDISLGSSIINHLYRLPLTFFNKRSVGELNSRVFELENIREFLTGTALTALLDAIFSIIYVIVMLLYSVLLTFCALGVIPFFIILTLSISPIIKSQFREQAKARAQVSGHMVETLNGIETIKSQNVELYGEWRWEKLYKNQIKAGFKNTITNTIATSTSNFLQQISGLIVIWVGAILVLRGELTLGGLIAFRILSGYVTNPILRIASLWQNFQETIISLERLSDVVNNKKEFDLNEKTLPAIPINSGNISFKNVNFRFQQNTPMQLQNINLTILAGQFVGIVGSSGSGKSTLLKLLNRFYMHESGIIEIDGNDISKVNLYSLRSQIGVVQQESLLFDGTITENISISKPNASNEEIVEASKIACAHEFISSMPEGYNSFVGERGNLLSGGQRQRIAIARMVLNDPMIVILDESTSALDKDTENRVLKNLISKFKGKTIIFISHRISSLRDADNIYVLNSGIIEEEGDHKSLLKLKGRYSLLAKDNFEK